MVYLGKESRNVTTLWRKKPKYDAKTRLFKYKGNSVGKEFIGSFGAGPLLRAAKIKLKVGELCKIKLTKI